MYKNLCNQNQNSSLAVERFDPVRLYKLAALVQFCAFDTQRHLASACVLAQASFSTEASPFRYDFFSLLKVFLLLSWVFSPTDCVLSLAVCITAWLKSLRLFAALRFRIVFHLTRLFSLSVQRAKQSNTQSLKNNGSLAGRVSASSCPQIATVCAGLVEVEASSVEARVCKKAQWSIKTRVFSLLSLKREPSSDASDWDDSDCSLDVDSFMPPYPKDYKDPVAID